MIPYIDTIQEDFPEEITSSAPSPHIDNLFKVQDKDKAKYLPKKQAVMFHHTVAHLLFLSMRAQPDIQIAVSFLTTRVKKPAKDNWGKVKGSSST